MPSVIGAPQNDLEVALNFAMSELHKMCEKVQTDMHVEMRSALREISKIASELRATMSEIKGNRIEAKHSAGTASALQAIDQRPAGLTVATIEEDEEDNDGETSETPLLRAQPNRAAARNSGKEDASVCSSEGSRNSATVVAMASFEHTAMAFRPNRASSVEPVVSQPGRVASWVTHPHFESIFGIFVVINVIALGVETQIRCVSFGESPHEVRFTIEAMEMVFCILFTAELSMRMFVYRLHFCVMDGWKWNLFDTVVVAIQIFDQLTILLKIEKLAGGHTLSALRTIRLVRIIRIVRLLHLFKELKVMVHSISKSTASLCWALVLLFLMIYTCSIFFTELALDADKEDLHHWFSSVPRTSLTLLECIIGGTSWDDPATLLLHHVGWVTCTLFITYIAVALFVLLNVVTGVFVDKAMRAAQEEADAHLAHGISDVFLDVEHAESNHDHGKQEITWDVFTQKLGAPALQDYFRDINVDVSEARGLFELIDADGSGSVDAEEIVSGCLRLKGPAKALDLCLFMRMQREMNMKLEKHIEIVDQHVQLMAAKFGAGVRSSRES